MFLRFSLPVLALLVAACGGGERPAPAAVPEEMPPEAPPVESPTRAPNVLLRGTVSLEPVPMFRSCDLEISARLQDRTAVGLVPVSRALEGRGEAGLYVLARGAQSPQGDVILEEIEFAGVPSQADGCEQPVPSYVVSARGVDPAWHVTVTAVGIEFTEGESATLQLPSVAPKTAGDRTVYEVSNDAGVPPTLTLTLQRTGCYQGTQAYTAIRAEALIDGRSLTGCAWRGKLP